MSGINKVFIIIITIINNIYTKLLLAMTHIFKNYIYIPRCNTFFNNDIYIPDDSFILDNDAFIHNNHTHIHNYNTIIFHMYL